jgi:hypothetical protein
MAGLPQFLISTQTDPYWEIPFYDVAGNPLSVEGRIFEAWISPATTKVSGSVGEPDAPVKVLTFQDGLSLAPPTDGSGNQSIKNTFVHQVSRAFAQANFPRGELTADILEVVDGARRLLVPVRLRYDDPAAIRDFIADRAGVTFGAGRQPIVTPVAVAGQAGRRGSGFLTGTLPPQPTDGEDGDYWIVDRGGQANTVYGPKEDGEWPVQPSSSLGVGGVADVPGLPAALTTKATIGHTAAPDADYQALVTDTQIGFAVLTAPRTVTLPDVDLYPIGQVLFIADESGQCSEGRRITIIPGTGTGDTIAGLLDSNGQPDGFQIADAYNGIGLRRGAANVWIIAR